MEKLKAGILFPNTLYLHGERGNVLALKRIAKEAGVDLEIEDIELKDSFHPQEYDILYMPAGELIRAKAVVDALSPVKEELKAFIRDGSPLVTTGTSCAFFGDRIVYRDGSIANGLGIIPAVFTENEAVYGDDIWFKTHYLGHDLDIVGNQILMADWVRSGGKPFGEIIYGYGNNLSQDEGIRVENSIFTNALGPVLSLNPDLTLAILELAAEKKGIHLDKSQVDTQLEEKGRQSRKAYMKQKKTNLTNMHFN